MDDSLNVILAKEHLKEKTRGVLFSEQSIKNVMKLSKEREKFL